MDMDMRLRQLFDRQWALPDSRLAGMIDKTEKRYWARALSDDDVGLVAAAREVLADLPSETLTKHDDA